MEGHDVAVSQAAVQGDLSLHLRAQPHLHTFRMGMQPTVKGRDLSGDPLWAWGPWALMGRGRTFPLGCRRPAPAPPRGTTLSANTALVDMSVSL